MVLAVIMMVSAGGILIYNNIDNNRAEEVSLDAVNKIEELIEKNSEINSDENGQNDLDWLDVGSSIGTKSSININGCTYIGIIYIPNLNNLAIPVIDTCTDANLKISACRYAGNIENNNIVIAGHNYKSLFGKLSKLTNGNIAYFKDLEGNVYKYKCKEIITLEANDVEKMQTGDWDLTLFTCTYDGSKRLTYRFEIM